MTAAPLISVIIPCYNAGQYLAECLRSVRIQRIPEPIEIIVVDDGSTDNSREIASRYPGVTLISLPKNMGECYASEVGFIKASGQYLCRLSADDAFISPYHLQRQINELVKYDADWCYNTASLVGPAIETSVRLQTAWLALPGNMFPMWWLDNLLLRFPNICYLIGGMKNPVNSSALMVRADAFRIYLSWKHNPARSCGDTGMVSDLLLHELKGRAIHSLGSFYRQHPGQTSSTAWVEEDHRINRVWWYSRQELWCSPKWLQYACRLINKSGVKQ